MLADPDSRIIGNFGLIDESAPADSSWSGFAHPIIFVVDRGGVVKHRFSEANYQNRPAVDVILEILREGAKG